jgi:hypothetical protein
MAQSDTKKKKGKRKKKYIVLLKFSMAAIINVKEKENN